VNIALVSLTNAYTSRLVDWCQKSGSACL